MIFFDLVKSSRTSLSKMKRGGRTLPLMQVGARFLTAHYLGGGQKSPGICRGLVGKK
jgi:hypothetical protein